MVPCFFLFFFGLNHKLRRYWWSPVSVGGFLLNQLQRKLVGLNSWAVSQDLLKYDGLIPQPKAENCYKLSVKRCLKAKRCFQDKTASVHAGERTEPVCSKAHRLRRARGASVIAQQSLVGTRAPRGEKAPSDFSTAQHSLPNTIKTLHGCAFSATPNALHVSVSPGGAPLAHCIPNVSKQPLKNKEAASMSQANLPGSCQCWERASWVHFNW